ncbi:MAG: DUF6247 family protein [Pseudonocardiaceae bacterium]
MTATWAYDEQPRNGHPLLPGAAPHHIRAALLPEDRVAFDGAYEVALVEARTSLDLTELFKTLEHWRRLALLQSRPGEYRRVVHRAAELLTGTSVPPDEPLAVTRARAGL